MKHIAKKPGARGRRLGRLGRAPSRLLYAGESAVASAGLVTAAVLLLGLGASAGWTMFSAHRQAQRALREKTTAIADVLASSVESLLADQGSVSSVRALVMNTAVANGLPICRVIVPLAPAAGEHAPESGGRRAVLADAETRNLTSPAVLVGWRQTLLDAEPGRFGGAALEATPADWEGVPETANRVSRPIKLPGTAGLSGATGLLLVADHGTGSVWSMWTVHTGVALIGAAAMSMMLLTYRGMRSRLRAIGAIREALVSMENGNDATETLVVSPELGPEAGAWNKLLTEREQLKEAAVRTRAGDRGSGGGGGGRGGGDLLSACDAMWQGVVLIDEAQRVSYVNGAAANFLRAAREQIAGKEVAKFIDDQRVLDAIRGVAGGTIRTRTTIESKRQPAEGETPGENASGGVLRYSVRAVRRDDRASALVVIEDVTQQRIADEARNAFVAQATHELRSPLTNIRLYIESLLESEDGAGDPVMRAKSLNVVNSEVRRLERIVGDMLSVSEIEAGSLSLKQDDVRLETLFPELEAEFVPQAREKEVDLAFVLPPKLPVIHGDRDKIVLALHNLVSNAIKYTPTGGNVTVKVMVDPHELRVEVADTGIGIKPEEHDRVFDRFYRAQDRRINGITGSGLGLALAREVARLHGGDITLRSEIDKGSTFTISLPVPEGAV